MIIVEDGSGKVDANSYVSVEELKGYLLLRGKTVTDDALPAALIRAADYLETCVKGEWKGTPLKDGQSLAWPRVEKTYYGEVIENYGVPSKLKKAQCLLASIALDGTDIMPVKTSNGTVIEETVGPITTKFADTSKTDSLLPTIAGLDGLLSGLFSSASLFPLKGVRV